MSFLYQYLSSLKDYCPSPGGAECYKRPGKPPLSMEQYLKSKYEVSSLETIVSYFYFSFYCEPKLRIKHFKLYICFDQVIM